MRAYLLKHALTFIRIASPIPGVESISLLGSITTKKQNPKDVDVIVVISDQVDLKRLALHGRKLKGAGQQINSGADVFLANEDGEYIGRTCSWVECRPRVRCEAMHCALRPHLCDDLQVVTLSSALVQSPPVTVWPKIVRRARLPQDVELLLKDFAAGSSTRAADRDR